MTLESLARTIAKARHGTDAMWANYLPSARAVVEGLRNLPESVWTAYEKADAEAEWMDGHKAVRHLHNTWIDALLAQPDGAQ